MNTLIIILIIIVIMAIISVYLLMNKESFTETDDTAVNIFPETKIINHPAYGYIKCFNNNDLVCSIILDNKIWEEDLFNNHIKPYVKENTSVFDCGAFIGSHTILINKLNRNNDIFSFEMMPEHYKLLVDNIKMNKYTNILPFNNALNDKYEWVTLPNINYNESNTNFGGTGINENISTSNIASIKLDDMEKYLRKPLSFIKMDVEGYELFALRGGLNIITKYKPTILIEVWKHLYDNFIINETYIYLTSIGYKINHVGGDDYLMKIDNSLS